MANWTIEKNFVVGGATVGSETITVNTLSGAKGEKGDKGDTGLQGIQGETGAQGLQGIQGIQGEQGIQGIQGEKGDTGEDGTISTPQLNAMRFENRVLIDGGTVDVFENVLDASLNLDGLESLVIAPLAYKESKVYALKPSDSPYADGTFTRVGTADRINQYGEVETMAENVVRVDYSDMFPIVYGDELVTNGGFDTDSDWNLGAGVSILSGVLTFDTSSAVNTTQTNIDSDSLNKYKCTFTISNYVRGAISISLGYGDGVVGSGSITTNGTFTVILTPGALSTTGLYITAQSDTILDLDNISVKQVYGNDTIDGEPVILLEDVETLTVNVPTGTTQIIETIDGVEQTPITTIGETHTVSQGKINSVKMY